MSYNINPLSTTTIVPENGELFDVYFSRLYDSIASAVNSKDSGYYQIAVSDTPVNIPNIPNFGAFIVCVGATSDSFLPTITASLCKRSPSSAGNVVVIDDTQVGTGTWAGIKLVITSTATNFQIAHDGAAGLVGNFNIKVIGTQ